MPHDLACKGRGNANPPSLKTIDAADDRFPPGAKAFSPRTGEFLTCQPRQALELKSSVGEKNHLGPENFNILELFIQLLNKFFRSWSLWSPSHFLLGKFSEIKNKRFNNLSC